MTDAPGSTPNTSTPTPAVVAIGASAGGLEALTLLIRGLPADLGYSYVIAQHMSPRHRSMMAEILGRETAMPVREIHDGELPLADHIHIVPPGHNLVFRKGAFRLLATSPEVSPKPSINLLFQALAEHCEDRAIGIVLSGTGSDGAAGMRAIKAAGGITFAQAPETAKYEGMPMSAIESGVVDHVLPPEQIGSELFRLMRGPNLTREVAVWQERPPELERIFELVQARCRIDFSAYKLSTVLRRLQRRLIATHCEGLGAYLEHVGSYPEELDALARETLISVTEFFRDREAFRALERHLRELVTGKDAQDEVRIWSVGCATGEEAYSLAMLAAEQMGERFLAGRLQVFATDIDNDALAFARSASYSAAALAELPREYLEKYFQPCERGYEPVKALRDCVVFARQDVTADPPFLRVDLVSCRNVMIYFNASLQAKVLSVLHYALREPGLLFLGRSETVTQKEELFAPLDRRNRIYKPRKNKQPASIPGRVVRGHLGSIGAAHAVRPDTSAERSFLATLARHYASAGMLVDGNGQILHSHGNVSRFMEFPTGTPELNLTRLVVSELRQEALTTLHRAQRKGAVACSRRRRIASLGGEAWRMRVIPAAGGDPALFAVVFENSAADGQDDAADSALPVAGETEAELQATREHLQTMLEEMASSNEEMQALSEEVQAANEELQATNEELEATNEELQATNEELISVNEESLIKSAELAAINADFESMYNTLEFPVLVFDAELQAKRANAAAIRDFSLPLSLTGKHVGQLRLPPPLDGLEERLLGVLAELRPAQFTATHEGRTLQVYLTPTSSHGGNAQGVVVVVIDQTELIHAAESLRESQERLLAIMNHSTSIIALKDTSGCYQFVNQRFVELTGLDAEAVIGRSDAQIFPARLAQALRRGDLQTMAELDNVASTESVQLGARELWFEFLRFPVFDASGVVRAVCTQATDITHRRHADEQLRLAAKVFDRSGEAIAITDAEARIITVNQAFTDITGFTFEEAIGQTPALLKSGRHSKEFYDAMWRGLSEQGWWQGEIFNRRKNGEIYPEWLTINAVHGQDGRLQNYVAIFSDITAIKSSQRRIEYMATHDELTSLPNRSLLLDRLKHGISTMQRRKRKLAVMFIDLDNFKNINDSLGHDIGDLLLKEAAQRLQRCVRDADTLARIGGDEFVALLAEVDIAELNRIATRIVDFLSASFTIRDHQLFVSASIGISVFPADGEDSSTLLKNADTAMYRAKERGRNQYQFFAEEMKVVALQRLTLETGLRQAIAGRRFRVVYQPQVELDGGHIVGAEALLRWHDPHLGEVSPAMFIPAAERAGLIGAIGTLVNEMVITQIAAWREEGLQPPRISVNVSAHQLRDDNFAGHILDLLDRHGVPADLLCVELTESVFMESFDATKALLAGLEKHGITISIDDFGTGYSSMAYLKRLPIHELKIDRSFVDGIGEAGDDGAITTAIIRMAQSLGLAVIAEGVENEIQADLLRSTGCVFAQGFLFHRPQEADDFVRLLRRPAG